MKTRIGVYGLAPLLLACVSLPLAAQRVSPFSADYKVTGRAAPESGKVYFSGDKMRLEMPLEGHMAVLIQDAAGQGGEMLIPDQHVYVDQSTANAALRGQVPKWRTYDPSNPCANAEDATCERAGTGTVNGHSCDKWRIHNTHPNSVETLWIDQQTGIPIRNEEPGGMTWELSNIQLGKPAADMFEVPSGYVKVDIATLARGMRQR